MKSLKTKPSPPKAGSDSQRSLFGEILDWMLAPLLFVWPISIAVTHYFANIVAAYPYDQALHENVNAIARQVKFVDGKPVVNLPGSARAFLRADEIDSVYFHVVGKEGYLYAGDKELPPPANYHHSPDDPGDINFRDAELNGQDLRIAYQYLTDPNHPQDRWLLVEVGETLEKRSQLANKIIASVILPQFVIIPLAVILVWFGLSQGLRPLTKLRERIEARRQGDLSPISTRKVPEELRPLIDAFNGMLERMRRNLEAQTRFIADAAHQMRTPLTGLKTQAQLAMRENDPERLLYALRQMAGAVDRASHLVNQLLTLARAEAGGGGNYALTPLDLDRLLREIVEDWVMRAMEAYIDIGFEPADAPTEVEGNGFLLREMINNLIDNALRYTPEGGHVTCRVRREDDEVILEVEDSGIGITEEQAELVFERFYRVNDSGPEGSGLGLPIVREIAELHGADASLAPNPKERGTIARVIFPAYAPPPPESDSQSVAQSVVLPPPPPGGV
ncbi:MAG TPA: sensor histidine kinase N-terminal domain-containing protein [Azospira sp.]|nr:sensor histidine kinase N-terminal domain-containing protein [Azospira sp.]